MVGQPHERAPDGSVNVDVGIDIRTAAADGGIVYVGRVVADGVPIGPYHLMGYATTAGFHPADDTSAVVVRPMPGEQVVLGARMFRQPDGRVAPQPAGDILDQIDAAVQELCACGCGSLLSPDGPSAYFASQSCQDVWHAAQATDPQEVYRAPDAALVRVGADGEPVPLVGEEPETPDTFSPIEDNEYRTAPRSECPHCLTNVSFLAFFDEEDDCDQPGENCRVYLPRRECGRCRSPLPLRSYAAAVHEHGNTLLFEMSDGVARTQRRVPVRRLHLAPDRHHLVALTWELMGRDVGQFRLAWYDRAAAALALPVVHPDPRALFRGVGSP